MYFIFFFFNDTATTEIYTLSLHDALPISWNFRSARFTVYGTGGVSGFLVGLLANSRSRLYSSRGRVTFPEEDRKSTRLNSSHSQISYAVFCLKKKKTRVDHKQSPIGLQSY